MARDLSRFGPGRSAADCFPYLGSDDLERMETGRCPDHQDAPLPVRPARQEPRTPPQAPRSYPPVRGIDLGPHRAVCELAGCERVGTSTARVVLGGGLEFLGVCDPHRLEIERDEIARRLRGARATADSWRLVRSDRDRYVSVSPRGVTFTAGEWEVISHGFVPRVMEDRWFWFAEGLTVHGRRSWTGIEPYRFHLSRSGDQLVLDRVEILDESDRYPDAAASLSTEPGRLAEADTALRLLRAELLLDAVAPG